MHNQATLSQAIPPLRPVSRVGVCGRPRESDVGVVIRAWRGRLSLRRTKRSRRAPVVDGTRNLPVADDIGPQAPAGDLAHILIPAVGIDPQRVLAALGAQDDELIDGDHPALGVIRDLQRCPR